MITNMLNMMSTVFHTPQTKLSKVLPKTLIENPFASPFVTSPSRRYGFEGKNQPVKGGYFAGYYNGKKNIVGKRLFVNV